MHVYTHIETLQAQPLPTNDILIPYTHIHNYQTVLAPKMLSRYIYTYIVGQLEPTRIQTLTLKLTPSLTPALKLASTLAPTLALILALALSFPDQLSSRALQTTNLSRVLSYFFFFSSFFCFIFFPSYLTSTFHHHSNRQRLYIPKQQLPSPIAKLLSIIYVQPPTSFLSYPLISFSFLLQNNNWNQLLKKALRAVGYEIPG